MNVMQMTRDDFRTLPSTQWDEDIGEFDSLVIIPNDAGELHESGWRTMTFAAVRGGEALCLLGGNSDVLHINGIGGLGQWNPSYGGPPSTVQPIDWTVDCLPVSGYLHIWCKHTLIAEERLSSFPLLATATRRIATATKP